MLSAVEEKLSVAQTDAQQVKSTVKQYEGLLDGYKTQVHENDGSVTMLYPCRDFRCIDYLPNTIFCDTILKVTDTNPILTATVTSRF